MDSRLEELLAKYLTHRISHEEKEELERLFVEHPGDWWKMGVLQQSHWELNPLLPSEKKEGLADKILLKDKIQNRGKHKDYAPDENKPSKNKRKIFALAILVLVIGGAACFFLISQKPEEKSDWQEITTKNGMRANIRLSDGSRIWLNAGSKLRYPAQFKEHKRVVYLEGEAFFDIKHLSYAPFIIHTKKMDTKVLGTKLDIRAYPDEDSTETSLISGAAAVFIKGATHTQKITLKPQQKLVLRSSATSAVHTSMENTTAADIESKKSLPELKNTEDHRFVLKPIKKIDSSVIPEIAWKDNRFIFENETLKSIAKRMERWYGVDIIIQDSTMANQRFTGSADQVSLQELLLILHMIKPFDYVSAGKRVIID